MLLQDDSSLITPLLGNTSVIVVTYNNQDQIENCLNSILSQKPSEVIVVDNNSDDETIDLIKNFPSVKLIQSPYNAGYSRGINLGFEHVETEYLVVLNADAGLKEGCLHELLKPLSEDEAVLTIPKALFYDERSVNTCGNIEHFTGLAFTRNLEGHPDSFNRCRSVNGLSGVCFAVKSGSYRKLGGFDENFFLYMEDVEFSWRILSRGLKILYVPTAVVCHDYKLDVNPEKIYYLETGRYMILRKYMTWKEYLILAPSLVMSEVLTWGYSILIGGVKFKLKAVKDGLTVDVEKEESSNRLKLLKSLDWEIPEEQLHYSFIDTVVKKFANLVYWLNYKLFMGRKDL